MKKIALIISKGEIGGAQAHVLSILQALKSGKLYDPILIVGSGGGLVDSAKSIDVRTYVIGSLRGFNVIGAALQLVKILKRERPELVHTHSTTASVHARLATFLLKIPVLYTVHGWHFAADENELKGKVKIAAERVMKGITGNWIFVSEYDRALSLKHHLVPMSKAHLIPNGVKGVAEYVPRVASNRLSVVFVGRVSKQKNCTMAIDILMRSSPGINLTMFVSGPNAARFQTECSKLMLGERLEVIINETQVQEKLGGFDCLLMTSLYEGAPLAVLEAMSAGLITISTNVCGLHELIDDGSSGFLFPVDCTEVAVEKLSFLLENLEIRSQMQHRAREVFQSKFTEPEMLNRTFSVYAEIIDQSHLLN